MVASLRVLLEHAIDYAGLFPPAALPMDQAVPEFQELIAGPNAWLVRRFVCPVAWLPDLLEHLPKTVDEPWPIAVLGTSLDGYRQDMTLIERFEEAVGDRALVEAYEVKANRADLGRGPLRHLADAGFEEVYIELPWVDDFSESLHPLVEVEGIGSKGRTGGLEPSAFPSNEQLGAFLHECLSLELPFKLTAGLHHAMPKRDEAIPARMHGFLNILIGCSLTLAHDLNRAELTSILAEDDPKAFWFTEKGAGYRDWEADLDDLVIGREAFVSWGSCSVQDPLDDLAAFGLFP